MRYAAGEVAGRTGMGVGVAFVLILFSVTCAFGTATTQKSEAIEVSGTVVDGQTGKPIDHFDVVEGIIFGDEQPICWQSGDGMTKSGHKGKFDYKISWDYPGNAVRIEAPGYLPAISRVFSKDEKNVSLAFKLVNGADISLTVLNPQGKPAKGATGVLALPGLDAYIANGERLDNPGSKKAFVGRDGKLKFGPEVGNFKIAVFGRDGYAEIDRAGLSLSNQLRLQAWAHVSGILMIGNKPARNEKVVVEPNRVTFDQTGPDVMNHAEVQTDASGHFAFDRVPPGPVLVARQIEIPQPRGSSIGMNSQRQYLVLTPGQSAVVRIGGMGRRIVGRLVVPAELASRQDWNFEMGQVSPPRQPTAPMPDEIKNGTPEQVRKWREDFAKTDPGKAFYAAIDQWESHLYPVVIHPDGTWIADDVAEGSYSVQLRISRRQDGTVCGIGEELANGAAQFTVPPMASGRSDVPLEIPTVSMTMLRNVEVGQVAPDFSLTEMDGKAIKLSALKGKYVLLDFWATWCGPCREEMPNVKAVYDAFGKNPRLVMISLSLDEKMEDAKRYVSEKGLNWHQVVLAGAWQTVTIMEYGVRGIPSIWLIGPDGKVVAKDLRGDAIRSAVVAALNP